MRRVGLLLILLAFGCGAPTGETQSQANEGAMETLTSFKLTTDAFEDGGTIPTQYSCDGEDLSPALSWSDPPPGTRSFALIMDDPDAPSGLFTHWAAYDIDGGTTSLPMGAGGGKGATGGAAAGGAAAFAQGRNSFGNIGYGGPCPPPGHGPHRYFFKLYALDVRQLTELGDNPSVGEVEAAAKQHQVAVTQIMGRYERR
jgi:Raf kinase inhibitor-like YbhB/YbcL family protein